MGYSKRIIRGIPCLQLDPSMEPRGTVLLYHGWSSTNESYRFFASLLADWGYLVIVPELPYHGERGILNYSDPAVLQQYFWRVVQETVREAEDILSELSAVGDVSIIGHSTGGFVAASLLAKASRLRAAVVINGSCAWVKFEEVFRERNGLGSMSSDEKASLEKHDPLSSLDFHDGRALLMLHGTADDTVPVDSQRYFIEVMTERGISSESVQLIEFPRVNHYITIQMLEKSQAWLDRHTR